MFDGPVECGKSERQGDLRSHVQRLMVIIAGVDDGLGRLAARIGPALLPDHAEKEPSRPEDRPAPQPVSEIGCVLREACERLEVIGNCITYLEERADI